MTKKNISPENALRQTISRIDHVVKTVFAFSKANGNKEFKSREFNHWRDQSLIPNSWPIRYEYAALDTLCCYGVVEIVDRTTKPYLCKNTFGYRLNNGRTVDTFEYCKLCLILGKDRVINLFEPTETNEAEKNVPVFTYALNLDRIRYLQKMRDDLAFWAELEE